MEKDAQPGDQEVARKMLRMVMKMSGPKGA